MSDAVHQFREHLESHGVPLEFERLSSGNAGRDRKAASTRGTNGTWENRLIRFESSGLPKPILANAITAFRFAPEFDGVLAYNQFSLRTEIKNPTPWSRSDGNDWMDYDDARACEWLQHQGILVSSTVTNEAVKTVAMEHPFHPVRDYLNGVRWDGAPRLDGWLITYLGAPDTPFVRAVGARWLISAIARVFQPGCQADYTLLLVGPQGIQKSTALRILAGDESFTDHISDLGSKDSRIELAGKWVIELAELDKVRRAKDLERVKAFLTARTDHFRLPYGRRAQDVPRSCVFAATVNDATPLTDSTGNRRFWPVTCGEILVDSLSADRDQLWAEAYDRYKNRAAWWLDTAELNAAATVEQDDRYDPGVWDELILDWVEDPTQREEPDSHVPITPFNSCRERVTVTDVLQHAIGKPIDRCTQADKNQVVNCLTHAGWERKQERKGPLRDKWFYHRPA